ncbi:MAG: hypothetical protein WBC13_11240, partial [Dokdonella sp.]
MLRTEVEVWILVGLKDLQIARRIGTPEEVIFFYRSLFFDVYGGATDYLCKHVVGFRGYQKFENHEVREFWLWTAMPGGGARLMAPMLKAMRSAHPPGKTPELLDYLLPGSKVHSDIQCMIAMAAMPRYDGRRAEWWTR